MAQVYYEAGLYNEKEWGVFSYGSCVWYFPNENTQEAAERYAKRLNEAAWATRRQK